MKLINLGLMINSKPNGFQTAMQSVCSQYAELFCGVKDFNTQALKLAEQLQPDITFIQIQQPGILSKYTTQKLSELSFVINWTGDVRSTTPEWMLETGKVIQLTAFSNMHDVNYCLQKGINADYLDIGFDPLKYTKHGIKTETPQIVAHFNSYGNMFFPLSQYRLDICETLKKEFGNNFGVFGNFPGAIQNFNDNQVNEAVNYNNAAIAINCSHFNLSRYSSDRILRILGSGCFCLSHNYTHIEKDYKIGKHLDIFNNLEELIKKCYYYLKNIEQRRQISENGYLLAHQNLTFKNMVENIVKLYKKHKT